MKILMTIILFSLAVGLAHAKQVEDVKILDLKFIKNSYELKLQIKDGTIDSYFFVLIVKEDENAFNKLAMVLKKMKMKDAFKLNLNIASFSPSPSGSSYHSERVTFIGSAEGESLAK